MDKLKSVSFEANNLLLNNTLWIEDVGASGGDEVDLNHIH